MRPILAVTLLLAACATTTPPVAGPKQYAVFFAANSAALDPAAVDLIAKVATAAHGTSGRVSVFGYTSSAGSRDANDMLSLERADRVADALMIYGVARSRIVKEGRGPTGTDPGVESRRVDIRIEE